MFHKIKPFQLSEPDRYSRLFPPAEMAIATTDLRLQGLAWSMCDKHVTQSPSPHIHKIRAGYTYFGQFIDHDVTFEDFRPLEDGTVREPRDTPNFRRNWLSLDTLYGGGPYVTPQLYDDDGASLKVGDAPIGAPAFDIPIDPSSRKPLIAEPRNLENAIVRQVHAMFLKLHNLAVKETDPLWPHFRRYSTARRRVCHQYQWLVRKDFLPRVCDRAICERIAKEPIFDWNGGFSIPIEFSRAAFRFGHSMVRDAYTLTHGHSPIPLPKLFGNKNSIEPLPIDLAVPWKSFFEGPDSPETANDINTGIVSPLFHIPGSSARLFRSTSAVDDELVLPHITLQRGAASRLPSGQTVRRLLNAPTIASENQWPTPWLDLEYCGLTEHTPLWYYILLEAEVNGHGTSLGPVGSLIVCEVIEGALRANKDSYIWWHKEEPEWKPERWEIGGGHKYIENLYDLAVVVGMPK